MIEQLYAMSGPAQNGQEPNLFMSLLPILIIFAIIYFLMIRPQSKRQKEKQQMLDNLQKGDTVITTGGIHGKIEGIKEKENQLILRIAKDVKVTLSKSSIASLAGEEKDEG